MNKKTITIIVVVIVIIAILWYGYSQGWFKNLMPVPAPKPKVNGATTSANTPTESAIRSRVPPNTQVQRQTLCGKPCTSWIYDGEKYSKCTGTWDCGNFATGNDPVCICSLTSI